MAKHIAPQSFFIPAEYTLHLPPLTPPFVAAALQMEPPSSLAGGITQR
jgi:hypothetical protein